MKFRNASATLALLGLLTVTPGCKDFYDVNVDPIHPSTAEPRDLLPGTQVAMATYLGFSLQGLGQATSSLVQQLGSTRGIGTFSQNGSSFNNQWQGLYTDMLANNELIIKQGTTTGNWKYVGIAQIQKAYVISQMVDMWGDIPYSQALQGIANRTPRFDKDEDIYFGNSSLGIQSLFSLIDEGVKNLRRAGGPTIDPTRGGDLIYEGNTGQWQKLARTLKLKLYNQVRKVRPASQLTPLVTPLLNPDSLMSEGPLSDFELRYGTSIQPENRNINFLSNYVDPAREDFIGIPFYNLMKTRNDPRIPYYFFNQKANANALGSVDYEDGRFVSVKFGSNGPLASAAAANLITLPGLYPAGGKYDNNTGGNADNTFGKGVVAQRLLTVFSRRFIEAEVRLMILGDATGARAAYEEGIKSAFAKVNAIALADGSPAITTAAINTYLAAAMNRYNTAGSDELKLQAIMEEKYVASFGFGMDAYTDYRRTGYPAVNFAVPGTNVTGAYPLRLLYRLQDLTTNPNAPGLVDVTTPIFWDR